MRIKVRLIGGEFAPQLRGTEDFVEVIMIKLGNGDAYGVKDSGYEIIECADTSVPPDLIFDPENKIGLDKIFGQKIESMTINFK